MGLDNSNDAAQALEQINKFAIQPLGEEDVFIFKAVLCDNEVDRDGEAFSAKALEKLAELFVGKTVISDHLASSQNQCARIYATEVVKTESHTRTGEEYTRLVAYCYMVRTLGNADLIAEIGAGIKKEVSVSCSIASVQCSVCGEERCSHANGKQYGGKLCYSILTEPTDAYEVSFVAVPAQPAAGVTKRYTEKDIASEIQAGLNAAELAAAQTYINNIRLMKETQMTKRMREIHEQMQTLTNTAKGYYEENEMEKAQQTLGEIEELKKQYEVAERIYSLEKQSVPASSFVNGTAAEEGEKKNAASLRAIIKKFSGQTLGDKEKSLLLPSAENTTGEHGEAYILPQDIKTTIQRKIRQYNSMRDMVGHIETTALTGSFPVEDFETVSELVDFADGTDGADGTDVKFKSISFAVKEKAAFIKLSNTLLALSDNALVEYVSEIFARKAVVTENKMILGALKANKTAKQIATWQELRSSINKDLDPAVLTGSVILTNQTGFDFLDNIADQNGRPLMQDSITEGTPKTFKGLPVYVFSNTYLPSVSAEGGAEKTPIFYGNLREAVKLVELGSINFRASAEAGFWSNTTVARLIEFIDVVQCDSSDKCYVYGEIVTAPAAARAAK